ncbi:MULTISPECIES: acetoin dehydrogenase dihydrolipoyllysine-residue acetyltransferase subunit [unclassified Inquilinus]|uniref:acetoin dehydrogenase dihydrolipoyllysine-residue acetyltransferase subunit n=1 Tax=unclassified Inquilinus TaxID=2645927 RepID=UPI003F8EDBC7
MSALLTLPRLGETMEEGVVVAWLKQPGDRYRRGEVLLEVETDKTVVEVPALSDGTLLEILVEAGTRLPVGAPIARVEDGTAGAVALSPPSPRGRGLGGGGSRSEGAGSAEPDAGPSGTNPLPLPPPAGGGGTTEGASVRASPAARRLADRGGVALAGLAGTGPHGRVTTDDVRAATAAPPAPAAHPATLAAGVRTQQVALADGRSIRYRRMGAAEATPIVMVHGFAGELLTWAANQGPLSARRPVYALDLPGHGGSSKDLGPGGVPGLAEALLAFLDAVGVGRAHLVGHSMGGAVVLQAALARPDRAASLTLIAPGSLGAQVNTGFIDRLLTADDPEALAATLRPLYADPALITPALGELVLTVMRSPGTRQTLRRLADQCFTAGAQRLVLRDRLGELTMPVKVLWGMNDVILPAHHGWGLPGTVALHLFPGQGHMLPIEAAAEVNRLVAEIAATG